MLTPKKIIENLALCVDEINELLTKEEEKIVDIEKLKSEKAKIEQYIENLGLLPEDHKITAANIKKELALEDHPEGGFFLEFIRTKDYTVIFYLLSKGEVSTWHALKNTQETFKLLSGDSLSIPHINSTGDWIAEEQSTYTNDVILAKGEKDKLGNWFGAYPQGDYSLVTCRCTPAFEYENFKLAEKKDIEILREKNPNNLEIIDKLTPKKLYPSAKEATILTKPMSFFNRNGSSSDNSKTTPPDDSRSLGSKV